MQAQSKNAQALTEANRAAIEGTQKLLQRQAEMIQQALSEATEAAKTIASSGGPKEAIAAQTKAIEGAFEKAIANATEITDLVRQTQDESLKMVNTRMSESLQELKESFESMK
ncbi:MAG: TIGR01841 family phasin [Ketobacter sp.]|nr:TIGR01841 family phasin [Ketobacter sp.]